MAGMRLELKGSLTPMEVVRRDESALQTGDPRIMVARCSELALTLGVSQDLTAEPARRAQSLGVPVYHRASGGAAVLHEPGDLFWSIVLPRSSPLVGRDYVHAYGRLGEGVVRALPSRLAPRWHPSPEVFPSHCFLSGRGEVLFCGDRILGGASQHVTPAAILHHGVILASVDPRKMEGIFGMPERVRSQYLTSLEELGITGEMGIERLGSALIRWLSEATLAKR